jgi:hypothetical protein
LGLEKEFTTPLLVFISFRYLWRLFGDDRAPKNHFPTSYRSNNGRSLSVPHQDLYTTYNHGFTQTITSTLINGVTSLSKSRAAACFLLLLQQSISSRWKYPFLAHDHENGPQVMNKTMEKEVTRTHKNLKVEQSQKLISRSLKWL